MEPTLTWHDALNFGVRGAGFETCETPYTRLPADAEGKVPEAVYSLSRQAAGLTVEFVTDSCDIHARLKITNPPKDSTLPLHGTVDLYVRHDGRWAWAGILKKREAPFDEGPICCGLPKGETTCRLYLPHGATVESLEIGVVEGSSISAVPADPRKPIVCYGTSIVHGFDASRPGMTMPAQLGRRLDYPVVNFGFSGNARMDPEMIPFLQRLDPAVLVIDCLPNMWPEAVEERTEPLIGALRRTHPELPILLVENIVYQSTYVLADRRGGWGPKNDMLKRVYARLLVDGVENVHYLTGEGLLGSDGDATTDGTHPNDVGMARLTDAYAAAIRPILSR